MTTSAPAATITGIDLIGATVADINRSVAFYRDTLGMTPAIQSDAGAEFHLPDGTTYGLWQPPAEAGMKAAFSIMFTVPDAKSARERFTELGASLGDLVNHPNCVMAFGTDPEGNAIIVHQRKSVDPHRPPAGTPSATTIRGIDIAGFLVNDSLGAQRFYHEVLGLTPTEIDDEGRGAEFTLGDGATFGVWKGDEGQPMGGFVMFAVDDAKTAVELATSRGAAFVQPLVETPVCHLAGCLDPDGNMVIIHQRKNG